MAIELIPAEPRHHAELAHICHLAFDALHTRHAVHRDVPSDEVGGLIIGGVLHRPDYVGVVAVEDGRILGSNFLLLADEVCGVGPITVDPAVQARGAGRMLMQWVIDEARRRRGARPQVRLFQEAINATSLSLYTTLGFRWRYAAAAMLPQPATADDASIRAMTAGDLPHVKRLSERHYGSSRANDAARLLEMGLPGFVRERAGQVVGYQIATLFGHAAAERNEDLVALAAGTARHVPQPMSVVIVPLDQDALFRAALAAGFRVTKVLNAMSLEEYAPPPGPCLPSIQC
jgi:GNAT superfamily N-acetyltransferase